VHVLLLEIPKLLRGILEHAIGTQPDCQVMKDERPAPEHAGPQPRPDVVILGITDADDETLLPGLFARWPHAHVMTLMRAGADAAVYQLRLDRRTLAGVSPDQIMQVLRETVGRSGAPLAEERSDPCPPS
jgi:hypothetical protein